VVTCLEAVAKVTAREFAGKPIGRRPWTAFLLLAAASRGFLASVTHRKLYRCSMDQLEEDSEAGEIDNGHPHHLIPSRFVRAAYHDHGDAAVDSD
jgi:hypothetical protein